MNHKHTTECLADHLTQEEREWLARSGKVMTKIYKHISFGYELWADKSRAQIVQDHYEEWYATARPDMDRSEEACIDWYLRDPDHLMVESCYLNVKSENE